MKPSKLKLVENYFSRNLDCNLSFEENQYLLNMTLIYSRQSLLSFVEALFPLNMSNIYFYFDANISVFDFF